MKTPKPQDEILRWPEVHKITKLSRTTVWRLVRKGQFPKPFWISTNLRGWLRSDIDCWIEERSGQVKQEFSHRGQR